MCIHKVNSTGSLPKITIKLENQLRLPKIRTICSLNALSYRGFTDGKSGMEFYSRAFLQVSNYDSGVTENYCEDDNLVIPKGKSEFIIYLAGDTAYNVRKGNSAAKFSFKGSVQPVLLDLSMDATSSVSFAKIVREHTIDYQSWFDQFAISMDSENSTYLPTPLMREEDDTGTDTLVMDYARYLLISTSRSNSLPPNLAGRWENTLKPASGDDYHFNGFLEMCYSSQDSVGLGPLAQSVWALIGNTLSPRGAETAQIMYGAPGWVLHDQSNIFGHTGMLSVPSRSNFPIAAAYITQSMWDYYEYTLNSTWYQLNGYPFIRGVAEFWVDQLQDDRFSKDGTLVAVPCNVPEHGPTTFGCTMYQHIIWEIFDKVLKSVTVVGERNQTFVNAVSNARNKMDKAVRFGDWGQIQEFKLNSLETRITPNNHLSQLYSVYPGYYIGSHLNNNTLNRAVLATLRYRREAFTGWANTQRATLWANIGQSAGAYVYLRRALALYFAPNLLSTTNGVIRMDGNCGYLNAMMNMLVFDKPRVYATHNEPRRVLLGPSIPLAWGPGNVRGIRLRGSGIVDFWWNGDGLVTKARLYGRVGEDIILQNTAGTVLGSFTKKMT
jgi:alpha-L-fucosidase 2